MTTKISISKPKYFDARISTKKTVTVIQGDKSVKFPVQSYMSNKCIRDMVKNSNLHII